MSKQILPHELAEIVTGLLVKPELLGELDSPQKHQAFILDIGRVVAEHCGGNANWVNKGDTEENYFSDQYISPYLSVSPNDCLGSLNNNVWAYHDTEGWEDEEVEGIEKGNVITSQEVNKTRTVLQCLLSNTALIDGKPQSFHFEMVDWRVPEGEGVEEAGDDRVYKVVADLGNQSLLEFIDDKGEPCFNLMIEINHGVPALHIDSVGQVASLHVHKAQGGLVLTPDYSESCFEQAELDRFSYNDNTSLVIR